MWGTKTIVRVCRFGLLMLFLSVTETGYSASLGSPVSLGRDYFEQYCSACHGLDGRGNGPNAHKLRTRPADLTQIARRHSGYFPERQIIAYIDGRTSIRGDHGREMPVWGRYLSEVTALGDGQAQVKSIIFALVQYLKTIQEGVNAD